MDNHEYILLIWLFIFDDIVYIYFEIVIFFFLETYRNVALVKARLPSLSSMITMTKITIVSIIMERTINLMKMVPLLESMEMINKVIRIIIFILLLKCGSSIKQISSIQMHIYR